MIKGRGIIDVSGLKVVVAIDVSRAKVVGERGLHTVAGSRGIVVVGGLEFVLEGGVAEIDIVKAYDLSSERRSLS